MPTLTRHSFVAQGPARPNGAAVASGRTLLLRRRWLVIRVGVFLSAAVLLSLLNSCFGGNTPERTYYSVQYPLEQSWSYESPRFPATVRVKRFDAALAYDRQEMVYRANPHEFQYYWYKLWASKPSKMLREIVVAHLRHTQLFADVVLDIGDRVPDYDLSCDILAIEELNSTEEQWFAHLSMRLTLTRFDDGATVWTYDFDERRPVFNRGPVYVVRTLSEIAADELAKAFAELDASLGELTGTAAPAGGPLVLPPPDETEPGEPTEPTEPVDDAQPKATLKNKR